MKHKLHNSITTLFFIFLFFILGSKSTFALNCSSYLGHTPYEYTSNPYDLVNSTYCEVKNLYFPDHGIYEKLPILGNGEEGLNVLLYDSTYGNHIFYTSSRDFATTEVHPTSSVLIDGMYSYATHVYATAGDKYFEEDGTLSPFRGPTINELGQITSGYHYVIVIDQSLFTAADKKDELIYGIADEVMTNYMVSIYESELGNIVTAGAYYRNLTPPWIKIGYPHYIGTKIVEYSSPNVTRASGQNFSKSIWERWLSEPPSSIYYQYNEAQGLFSSLFESGTHTERNDLPGYKDTTTFLRNSYRISFRENIINENAAKYLLNYDNPDIYEKNITEVPMRLRNIDNRNGATDWESAGPLDGFNHGLYTAPKYLIDEMTLGEEEFLHTSTFALSPYLYDIKLKKNQYYLIKSADYRKNFFGKICITTDGENCEYLADPNDLTTMSIVDDNNNGFIVCIGDNCSCPTLSHEDPNLDATLDSLLKLEFDDGYVELSLIEGAETPVLMGENLLSIEPLNCESCFEDIDGDGFHDRAAIPEEITNSLWELDMFEAPNYIFPEFFEGDRFADCEVSGNGKGYMSIDEYGKIIFDIKADFSNDCPDIGISTNIYKGKSYACVELISETPSTIDSSTVIDLQNVTPIVQTGNTSYKRGSAIDILPGIETFEESNHPFSYYTSEGEPDRITFHQEEIIDPNTDEDHPSGYRVGEMSYTRIR